MLMSIDVHYAEKHAETMPTTIERRWLNRDEAAAYVGKKKGQLARLLKAGKMPIPSYHFGPKSPRWDRLALDAMFSTGAVQGQSLHDEMRKILAESDRKQFGTRSRTPKHRS